MKLITKLLRFTLFFAVVQLPAQQINPSFLVPDTVCLNEPVTFTNTSTGPIDSYYWSFCSGNLAVPTVTANYTFPSANLSGPVYLSIVKDGLNYHIFLTNNFNGRLLRLDYGNNLNSTPTVNDLGIVINNLEDIHVEKEGANWYGIAVGGMGVSSAVCRLDFGTSITNPPIITNMGNIGQLNYPVTLHIFRSGGNIYGFTFSYQGNTITRFDFGSSFANIPTGSNLGNIGSLSVPSQMAIINHNGTWNMFICNDNGTTSTLSRLDFGNSLLNTPTGVNLGNLGGMLNGPRGLALWTECNEIKGMIANRGNSTLFDLSFPMGATGPIGITPAVNTTILSFPQTIKRYRIGDYIANYIVNVGNNSISRIDVSNCQSLPSFSSQNIPAVTFTAPGLYTAYLTCNESAINQASFCKNIYVKTSISIGVSPSQTVCIGNTIQLKATGAQNYTWSTGATSSSVSVVPFSTQVYTVVGSAFQGCQGQNTVSISVSECVSLSDWKLENNIKVYPTPTTGRVTLEIFKDAKLVLVNAVGSVMLQTSCKAGIHELNMEGFQAGMYILSVITGNGVFTSKVLKE